MRQINEIFHSLQGEGYHTGIPSVFIRFAGCNLTCPFCDTNHHRSSPMPDDQIVQTVNLYNAPRIILTGGEPSLQIDRQFIDLLHKKTDKLIAIETNGTQPLPESIDWITVSPKQNIGATPNLPLRVQRADEIKVVDCGQDLEQYFHLSCRRADTLMYLQPRHTTDADTNLHNCRRTVQRVMTDPRWMLSAQMHRYLQIP